MRLPDHDVRISLIWRQRHSIDRKKRFAGFNEGEIFQRSNFESFVERKFLLRWLLVYSLLTLIRPKVAEKLIDPNFKIMTAINVILLRIAGQANANCLASGAANDDLCVLQEVANVEDGVRLATKEPLVDESHVTCGCRLLFIRGARFSFVAKWVCSNTEPRFD